MRNFALALSVLGIATLAGNALADDIKIEGAVSSTYTYNTNKPKSGSNAYSFNNRDAQFQVNYANLSLSKAATEGKSGFKLSLLEGDVRDQFFAASDLFSGSNPTGIRIMEAYISSVGSGSIKSLDFGQFLNHVGYEVPQMDNLISRSYQYQFTQPYYGTGVRAQYGENLKLYLYNRFNGAIDNDNRDLAYGFQSTSKQGESSTITVNGLLANGEKVTSTVKQNIMLLNAVLDNKVSDKTNVVFEVTNRTGKTTSNTKYNALAVGGYLVNQLGSGDQLTLRGEYVNQAKSNSGLVVNPDGGAQAKTITSITAAYQFKKGIVAGGLTTLEVRFDNADSPFFVGKSGAPKKAQSTIAIGQTVKF
jgi:hypothetical protein